MAVEEVRVGHTDPSFDIVGKNVTAEFQRVTGRYDIDVSTERLYWLEGVTPDQTKFLVDRLFCEPVSEQQAAVNTPFSDDNPDKSFIVAYKPGVMNPERESIQEAAEALGVLPTAVESAIRYKLYGEEIDDKTMLAFAGRVGNSTVHNFLEKKPDILKIEDRSVRVQTVRLAGRDDNSLRLLSSNRWLYLDLDGMRAIQAYFETEGRDPTDCELPVIAAWWSEHCGHPTFKSDIEVDGVAKPPLYTRIKEAARQYFGKDVISAFADNSGVIDFYEGQAICGKGETHISPSAIAPYGGAETGVGGVLRDINETGQGAKPIAISDILVFAPPDLDPSLVERGCLPPDHLRIEVLKGIRDYGNRMGVPTNNGSEHFHSDFRAKPTVLVTAYGILSVEKAQKGTPQAGDIVFALGGRTGRDGIGGATYSSREMTDGTKELHFQSVQIGNAIEEKKMFDAILEARDKGFIRAITDCGAAGFSSAIGEIGSGTGVNVDISRAPLKYAGLAPWETWMSESQERAVAAVYPSNADEMVKIFEKYGSSATALGTFDSSKRLKVMHGDQVVVDLDYDFLENGRPRKTLKAKYEKNVYEDKEPDEPTDWVGEIKAVLSHGNVCSKEPVVRQYDHTVQGTNALSPFSGVHNDGPNDAAIVAPILGKPYGVVTSHGLNPVLSLIDPYRSSIWACTEGMANYVAAGGDPETATYINNYISPPPDEKTLGALDKVVDGVVDFMHATKRPVISGKDSLSSRYVDYSRFREKKVIDVPPYVCLSVFGKIPDVMKTSSADIKTPGSTLCLVGRLDSGMAGSTYYDTHGIMGNDVPKVDLTVLPQVFDAVHAAIVDGKTTAVHDVSEGGVITTVSEMCFGGDCGADIDLSGISQRPDMFLFNETAGCFVVEVKDDEAAKEAFGEVPYMVLGKTTEDKIIKARVKEKSLFAASTDELKRAWQEPTRRFFNYE